MTLVEFQRRMAGALLAPLGPGDRLAPAARREALALVKPNGRLTAPRRLEIYARSYWYRVLDAIYDDFPGLRAIVGARAFHKLTRAYLAELPSQSFTLRDLGSRLPKWLALNSQYAGRHHLLALDMARLEWAHVEAFDGPAAQALGPEDLLELSPETTFRLQPHVTLLALAYPVGDLRLRVAALEEGHGEASNAVLRRKERRAVKHFSVQPEAIHLAVHRVEDSVYFCRLDVAEFRLLDLLRAGKPVGEAIESVFDESDLAIEELRGKIEAWFRAWAERGWLCHSAESR